MVQRSLSLGLLREVGSRSTRKVVFHVHFSIYPCPFTYVGKVSSYNYVLSIILEKFVKVPCLFFISLRLSRGSCFDLLSMILVLETSPSQSLVCILSILNSRFRMKLELISFSRWCGLQCEVSFQLCERRGRRRVKAVLGS